MKIEVVNIENSRSFWAPANFKILMGMLIERIIMWIASHFAEIVSVGAIIISVVIAVRQRNLDKRIALYDKRDELIHKIYRDELPERLDVDLYFTKCLDKFDQFVKAKQEVDNAGFDVDEYFNYLSEDEHISPEELKIQFQLADISADEAEDDSFIQYCEERTLCYKSIPAEEYKRRNYIELSEQLQSAESRYRDFKNKLIEDMKTDLFKH